MKGGNKLFIFAGVLLAAVAIVLGIVSFSGGGKSDAKTDTKAAKVTVVEAAADIPAHSIITAADVVEKQVASTDAPADAANSSALVVGQAYRVAVVQGQRLQTSQLEIPGLRNDVAVGKRAIALPVNEVSALSGLIQEGDYVDVIFHARINTVRVLPSDSAELPEDGFYVIKEPVIYPPDLEQPNHPPTGDPGSKFYIRDDVGDAQNLEAVAKIMLQDVRVLRVVRPGEQYSGNGERVDSVAAGGTVSGNPQDQPKGQLILEVSPAQAEMVTFMQDKRHEYQVMVRGKDDHDTVNTKGLTFQILATNADWALPWPQTLSLPKEQKAQSGKVQTAATPTAGSAAGDDSGASSGGESTPTPTDAPSS